MGLPGKVCDLCQICNWARTVTMGVLADDLDLCIQPLLRLLSRYSFRIPSFFLESL